MGGEVCICFGGRGVYGRGSEGLNAIGGADRGGGESGKG